MKLFRIPDRNDDYSERSGLWLKLLNEKTENIHKIRVCSEHFLNSNLLYKLLNILHFTSTNLITFTFTS